MHSGIKKNNWDIKLYNSKPPFSKTFFIQTRGAVLSHLAILKFLPARSHFVVQFWREPIQTDLRIQKLKTF